VVPFTKLKTFVVYAVIGEVTLPNPPSDRLYIAGGAIVSGVAVPLSPKVNKVDALPKPIGPDGRNELMLSIAWTLKTARTERFLAAVSAELLVMLATAKSSSPTKVSGTVKVADVVAETPGL